MAAAVQCVGPSMLPTLQPRGDVLLHEKASIMLQRVQVGADFVIPDVMFPPAFCVGDRSFIYRLPSSNFFHSRRSGERC